MNKIFIVIIAISALIFFLGCSKKEDSKALNSFVPVKYEDSSLNKSLLYRLYVPENYESSKQYPLILYLHDGGGNGNDNKTQINEISEIFIGPKFQAVSPSFVMIPQCPKGEQWVNTRFKKVPFTNYKQDQIPESNSVKMIINALKTLQKKFSIDKNRLYITGYSMGGSGTWDVITRYPDIFAAAVPVTGVSDPSKAKKISKLPLWAFHGAKDHISLVQNTRNMVKKTQKYNSDCKYTEYDDIGHGVWHAAYDETEMVKWLFSQRK